MRKWYRVSRRTLLKVVALATALFGVMTSLGSLSVALAAPAPGRVIIALPSISVNQLVFHLAREVGLYREEGLEIITPVIRPNLAIAGLVTGEVDYTLAGDSVAYAAMSGVMVRHIGCINLYQAFQFVVNPKISNPVDLKGKTFAVTSVASTTALVTQLLLRRLGLNPDADVNFVNTGTTANALAALQAERVAGALLSPPFDIQAQQLGFRSLLTVGDLVPISPTCFGASSGKLADQPAQVRGLLRASLKGARLLVSDREKTVSVLMRLFKLEREIAESIYKTHRNSFDTNGLPTEKQLEFLISQGKSRQKPGREIGVEDFTDYRQLREVQRELGL